MNPWVITAWVGAISSSAIIVAITISIIYTLATKPKRDHTTRIM